MITMNTCIILICIILILLLFLICNNDILNIFFNKTLITGGNTATTATTPTTGTATATPATTTTTPATTTATPSTTTPTTGTATATPATTTTTPATTTTTPSTTTPVILTSPEIKEIENKIKMEQKELELLKNELESVRNNPISNYMDDTNNVNPLQINREIIDTDSNAINTVLENDELSTIEEESMVEEEEILNEEQNKIVKPYENMCENDYSSKRKKSLYNDLKLNLNTDMNLEPFNNDDFSEYGQFNC